MVNTDAVKVSGSNVYTFELLDDAGAVTNNAAVASGYCIDGKGGGKGSGATITFNSEKGGVGSATCP
jgi:hypothetical protein